ncbi:hypothetical protein [Selenomonas ruminantium]|uniref:hypothetical protein n=1 Tax=Selenomonas ruminantium TaxID=971 RepID=UPI0026EBCF05|nr:hypothetical protein [Selenomonas ruminantium]
MINTKTIDTNKYLNDNLPVELKEAIANFYDKIKQNDIDGLSSAYKMIYFEAKDSWKFKEISIDKMREIQEYFRRLANG